MENDQSNPVETPSVGSKKTRLVILLLNVVLVGLVHFGFAYAMTDVRFGPSFPAMQLLSQLIPFQVELIILTLALLLCGWGPGPVWLRFVCFLVACGMAAMMRFGIAEWLQPIIHSGFGPIWLKMAKTTSAWVATAVPALIVLVWIGSLFRVRIAKPSEPGVKASIMGLMVVTTLVGVAMTIDIALQQEYTRRSIEILEADELAASGMQQSSEEIVALSRTTAITRALIAGPLWGLFGALLGAAVYGKSARIALFVLLTGFVLFAFLGSSAPIGFQTMMIQVAIASIITFALAVVWAIFCIRWLGRTGWPMSKRPASNGGVQGEVVH